MIWSIALNVLLQIDSELVNSGSDMSIAEPILS